MYNITGFVLLESTLATLIEFRVALQSSSEKACVLMHSSTISTELSVQLKEYEAASL